jgi:hypothetical protein
MLARRKPAGLHRLGMDSRLAKDEASPYKGGRTLSWIKVRQKDYTVENRVGRPEGAVKLRG